MSAIPHTHPPLHRHTREHRAWTPKYNKWVIAFGITIATFMEVLDTSVANVALPHIAGGLAVNHSESTWVLTSYMVCNAVVLPMSAWFSTRIGRKRFYMASVALFTMSSALCGFAPSLTLLILFRILQGGGGGGLAPSEQGILADTYTAAERPTAFAIYGTAVILAPAIGPIVGGWVTDHYSWRWIFFINVPAGLVSLFLTYNLIEDPPYLTKLRMQARRRGERADYAGLILLVLFVGPLQVLLDRGQELNWFQSRFIQAMAVTSSVSLAALIFQELRYRRPAINLRLFGIRNFCFANLQMFVLGFVLYGAVVLLPEFVQALMGYSATDAGLVLSPGALAAVAMMPVAGALVARMDSRWLVGAGFLAAAAAFYHMTTLELGMSFHALRILRLYQAGALAFLFIPINMLAYSDIPEGQNDDVSALINLSRNIGGSFGIALMSTMVTRRAQVHQSYLAAHITGYDSPAASITLRLSSSLNHAGVSAPDSLGQAYARLYQGVQAQASTMAYIDAFWAMALICACMVPLVILMRRSDPARGVVLG